MNLWYKIRRPIGCLLFSAIFTLGLIVIHAIPYLLTDLILGL